MRAGEHGATLAECVCDSRGTPGKHPAGGASPLERKDQDMFIRTIVTAAAVIALSESSAFAQTQSNFDCSTRTLSFNSEFWGEIVYTAGGGQDLYYEGELVGILIDDDSVFTANFDALVQRDPEILRVYLEEQSEPVTAREISVCLDEPEPWVAQYQSCKKDWVCKLYLTYKCGWGKVKEHPGWYDCNDA